MSILLYLAIFLVLLGIILLLWTEISKRTFGILHSKRLYEDTATRPGRRLTSDTIALVGNPDYLIEHKQGIIPVEVKTGRTPEKPRFHHVLQLIAYCHLVEQNYRKRPQFGIIKYPEKEFEVLYTLEYEKLLFEQVNQIMRFKSQKEKPTFVKNEKNLCRECSILLYSQQEYLGTSF